MEIQIGLKEKFAIDRRWHIFKDKSRNFSSSLINPIINSLGKILSINKVTLKIVGGEESHDDLNKQIKDLEELNEHKENILSLIAHDLRSPLASIISIADHLKSNFTTSLGILTTKISSAYSNPTEMRIRPGVIFTACLSASVSLACVVLAG